MKRLRIYARVYSFWNPCVLAINIVPTDDILTALGMVCARWPKTFSFTLE